MEKYPPRPCLALAVSVIGHRPNRLPAGQVKLTAIASEITAVLTALGREVVATHNKYAEYFSGRQPSIAVISALAEGADRLGAHAVIELQQTARQDIAVGFHLDVPL